MFSPARYRMLSDLGPHASGAIGYDANGNPTVSTGSMIAVMVGGLLMWALIIGGLYYIIRAVVQAM